MYPRAALFSQLLDVSSFLPPAPCQQFLLHPCPEGACDRCCFPERRWDRPYFLSPRKEESYSSPFLASVSGRVPAVAPVGCEDWGGVGMPHTSAPSLAPDKVLSPELRLPPLWGSGAPGFGAMRRRGGWAVAVRLVLKKGIKDAKGEAVSAPEPMGRGRGVGMTVLGTSASPAARGTRGTDGRDGSAPCLLPTLGLSSALAFLAAGSAGNQSRATTAPRKPLATAENPAEEIGGHAAPAPLLPLPPAPAPPPRRVPRRLRPEPPQRAAPPALV